MFRIATKRITYYVPRLLISLALLLSGLEISLRYFWGLGNPPLSIAHPKIEYQFAPFQNIDRYGNRFITNAWGMRSQDFPRVKLHPDEKRILIFGDSVVNGGALTDHAALATSITQQKLRSESNIPAVVGNVSAGSWGPSNWLAFSTEYGFFDADVVILLVNSDDAEDCPTFERLDATTHPTKRPLLAIGELFSKSYSGYIAPRFYTVQDDPYNLSDVEKNQRRSVAIADLEEFLTNAQRQVGTVFVIQYLAVTEITEGITQPGYNAIRNCCEKLGIPVDSTRDLFSKQLNEQPFRDHIHPNLIGQELLSRIFLEKCRTALQD
jgi:lysophospholipase L1-like esterase